MLRIDGRFSEDVWQRAARMSELRQVTPVEGAKPSRSTSVRICFDADYLYLAFVCEDESANVSGRLMERDARLDPDDRIEFWFDTFHDQRFAYWFQVGAGGSKGDALLSDNGNRFNKSWDGIWRARIRQTAKGWQAEIAIPFKTLAFKEGLGTWGFNLRRHRKVSEEEMRWASPSHAYSFFRLSEGGHLVGLNGMHQGLGLDLVPYAKVSSQTDRTINKHTSVLGDVGGDLTYRLTPAMAMRLTFNTDFAETEVDQRQNNLTRFPLFFPEKRSFFLEDAGMFEFGSPDRGGQLVPFFSRRIGRDDTGNAVPLLAGAKLTGRSDGWNIGFLEVLQDEHNDQQEKGLGVLRLSRNLGGENSVGLISTLGQPTASGQASTLGVDFRVGSSRALCEGQGLSLWGYWVGTQMEGAGGDGGAYGLQLDYDTSQWEHSLRSHHVERGFNPALGFVRRTDIRTYSGRHSYTWRNEDGGMLRRLGISFRPEVTTTLDGGRDGYRMPLEWLEVNLDSEDSVEFTSERRFDRLHQDFMIRPGITVPAGDYTVTRHEVELRTADRRLLSVVAALDAGGFFDGHFAGFVVAPALIPSRYLQLSASYREDRVVLDAGSFTTRITEGRVDVQFSPRLSWKNLLQYDTESKNLGAQSRLRWIRQPGQELFLVGLFGWQKADHFSPYLPTNQEIALKVLYTLRF